MPSTEEIEDKVIAIVSEQLSVDKAEIKRETSFVDDLNADSLDTVELVMELEDEFDLSIPDEDAEKLQTVGSAIEYIEQHASVGGKS
ncbi:MAG: acyl carrier protein [Planctomycetes bacterium]|nr:acyl carrier protein [Planctomycetota bacterium]